MGKEVLGRVKVYRGGNRMLSFSIGRPVGAAPFESLYELLVGNVPNIQLHWLTSYLTSLFEGMQMKSRAGQRKGKEKTSRRNRGKGASTRHATGQGKHRWVRGVKTVSTFPPPGLFTKSAPEIARTLASPKVSPKGPSSGMRMLTYFINRAGKGLSATRKRELERAKRLLSERIRDQKRAA